MVSPGRAVWAAIVVTALGCAGPPGHPSGAIEALSFDPRRSEEGYELELGGGRHLYLTPDRGVPWIVRAEAPLEEGVRLLRVRWGASPEEPDRPAHELEIRLGPAETWTVAGRACAGTTRLVLHADGAHEVIDANWEHLPASARGD